MRPTLTHRVLIWSTMLIAIAATAAAVTINSLLTVNEAITFFDTYIVAHVRLSGEYNTEIQRALGEITAYSLNKNTQDAAKAEASIAHTEAIMNDLEGVVSNIARLHESGQSDDNEHQSLNHERQKLLEDVQNILHGVTRIHTSGGEVAKGVIRDYLTSLEQRSEQLVEDTNEYVEEDTALAISSVLAATQSGIYATAGSAILLVLFVGGMTWLLQRRVIGPVRELSLAAARVASGNLQQRVSTNEVGEIGQLQQSFNQMVASLHDQHQLLEQRNRELDRERAALEQALSELRRASEERTMLLEHTVEQLSAPVLPVLRDVLVLPIIGTVGERRSRQIQQTLLESIEKRQARMVIIDVTALVSADTLVVRGLLDTIQSSQLLGAQAIIVGINPAVASTLVQIGAPIEQFRTMADLQAAVAFAITRR